MAKTIRIYFTTLFFLTGFFLTTGTLPAQNNPAEDKAAQMLNSLKQKFASNNFDTVYIDAKRLTKFSQSETLPYYEGQSKYLLGRYYLTKGNSDSSLYCFNSAERIFYHNNDTLEQGKMNFFIGVVINNKGDTKKALGYYKKSSDLLELAGDTTWYGVANDYIGSIYFREGNYILALKCYQKALAAFKLSQDTIRVGGVYNSMGVVYRKTNDKDKEEEAYLNTIKYLEQANATVQLGMAYSNLSEVYLDKDEIERAFETLEKAKEIFEIINYPLGICSYYAVLTYYYSHTDPPDWDKVIEYGEKRTAIAEEQGDFRQYADATSYLGRAYLETNQLDKAKWILKKGIVAAEEGGFKDEIVKVARVLSEVYDKARQPQKALYFLKKYIQYKDSISSEEKIKEFTSLDLGFKFREQQLSDSLINVQHRSETKFQYENEIQTQKYLNYFFIVVSLFVIAFAIYMFFSRRRIKTANLLLAEKNEQINNQKIKIETYAGEVNLAYSKLQELDEYKQAMVNMLVHDLKNPLDVLVNIDLFEEEEERNQIINHTSRQMLNLTMNMLDVNRAENNIIALDKSEIYFNDIAYSAIKEVDFLCAQNNIDIVNSTTSDYKINADSNLLNRVFVNIFTNAIKFSPSNSTIILDTQIAADNQLIISVEDQGPGIAKEYHKVIFEKFKQLEQVKSGEVASTGLGLAFCKIAVETHGWTIGVDSQPGDGAKFWVRINDYQKI